MATAASGVQPSAPAATYQGADREQKLIAGAREEGSVMVYTSLPPDDMNPIVSAFEAKYGVKVQVWRSSAANVLQRGVTEARAQRFDADVYETNGPQLEAMHREKVLQKVESPYLKTLMPDAIQPHGEWVATRLNVFTAAYNVNAVKKADLPKTYQDLLDPKWKGKIGIEGQDSVVWFAGVVDQLGGKPGVDLFKQIVTKNNVSVRRGHTLLANLVASGEVPFALGLYNYKTEEMKQAGAPIDWLTIGPAITQPNGIGIARMSRHPNAAVLFYDFELTDGEVILADHDLVPTSTKVKAKILPVPMKLIDNREMLDNQAKNQALFDAVFNTPH
jgi:iron(III) transport system substrate-binding protein